MDKVISKADPRGVLELHLPWQAEGQLCRLLSKASQQRHSTTTLPPIAVRVIGALTCVVNTFFPWLSC